MRLCIFEDRTEQMEPLSLTRPVFDLRCGITSLAAKQARHVGTTVTAVLVRPVLEDIYRVQVPGVGVNDMGTADRGNLLLVNGRWLPPLDAFVPPAAPCVGLAGDAVAYVRADDVNPRDQPRAIARIAPSMAKHAAGPIGGGRLIDYPWDLVEANADEIRRDFTWLNPAAKCGRGGR